MSLLITRFQNNLKQVAKILITPTPAPESETELRRAQILLAFAIASLVIAVTMIIIRYSIGEPYIPTNVAPVLIIGLYILGRFGYYRIAIYAGVLAASLLNPVIIFLFPTSTNPITVLTTAIVAILLAEILLPKRNVLGFVVLNISLVSVIVALLPNTTIIERVPWIIPVIYIGLFTFIRTYVTPEVVGQSTTSGSKSSSRFHYILDTLPDAILVHNENGAIAYANHKSARLLGYTTGAELIGLPLTNFVQKGQSTNVHYQNVDGITSVRYQDKLYPKSGEPFSAWIVTTLLAIDDEIANVVIIHQDQTRTAVHDELAILKASIQLAPSAIFVAAVDAENDIRIRYVNPAYTKMTGYVADDLRGRVPPLLRALENEIDIKQLYTDLARGVSKQGENILHRLDGQPLTAQWSLHPLNIENEFKYVIGIQEDITMQVTMQLDLHNKQERFSMMSDLMSDYAYALVVKPDNVFQFQWMTGTYAQVFGRSYDELITYTGWEALVHPDERALYQTRQAQLLAGESGTIEYRIVRPDGTIRWVSDSTRAIKDEVGHVLAIYGAAHDVTERVLADEALRLDAFQKAVVAELGLLALKTDVQEDLLQHMLTLCQTVLETTFSMVVANERDHLQIIATSSNQGDLRVGTLLPIDKQQSLAGFTLASKDLVVTSALNDEENFSPLPAIRVNKMRSGIGIVIQGANTPFGVLTMYNQTEREFTDNDIIFLEWVANVVGTFMERLRAQQAEREERDFAEALREATIAINAQRDLNVILKQILDTLARLIPHQTYASVLLWDAESQAYRYVSLRGYPEDEVEKIKAYELTSESSSVVKKMLETSSALVIPNIQEQLELFTIPQARYVAGFISVPIKVSGNVLGFMILSSVDADAYSERDAERMQYFAEKVGNAILNARHAEDLQRMVQVQTAELQQEREQLEAILDATGDGIFYTEEGVMRYANRALAAMTGYELDDFIGTNTNILHPLDIDEEELDVLKTSIDAVTKGETWRRVVRLKRKDNSVFPAGLTISRVGQGGEAVRRAVAVVRDTSQEREIEQFRSRFIADAAHELRSPITNLNTSMYLIGKQPEKVGEHIDRLRRVIDRMNHLVRDLLDTFAFEQGHIKLKKEVTILQKIVADVVNLQTAEAHKKSIMLVNQMHDEPIQLLADAHRLEQVFTNLINNAINHTLPNGRICLYCMQPDDDKTVVIVVEDTGKGISAKDLQHIFQPFFRVDGQKPETGTGLGLSITQDIVTLHGGKLDVSSEIGVGTKIYVTLPILDN